MVLELARPSEARCFPPAGDFFEAVLLQQPQATEAVEKCCFFRISDDMFDSWSFESFDKQVFDIVCTPTFFSGVGGRGGSFTASQVRHTRYMLHRGF